MIQISLVCNCGRRGGLCKVKHLRSDAIAKAKDYLQLWADVNGWRIDPGDTVICDSCLESRAVGRSRLDDMEVQPL